MKKVGILTFHTADNYGAVLQAYGLKRACEGLGFEAGIVDYSPEYITNQYRYFKMTKSLRNNLLKLYNVFGNIQKKRKFDRFRRERLNIQPYDESEYAAILCGSDQIWNPNISGDFDPVYFGKTTLKAGKKIAYAASIGISELTEEQKEPLRELLLGMDSISVREKSMIPMLAELTPKKLILVLDPTLLNTSEDWDQVAAEVKGLPEKYIFVYEVAKHAETMEKAKYVSRKTGYPIIELVYEKNRLYSPNKQENGVGPAEFITYIKNASWVVTSSFHGTAFSIIYRKNFYTVPHKRFSSRMRDLLESLGLSERIVSNDNIEEMNEIDYCEAEEKLRALRKKSLGFIRDSIEREVY